MIKRHGISAMTRRNPQNNGMPIERTSLLMDLFEKLKNLSPASPIPSGPVEYLIAGLGNIGTQYENTRHNAGFMALDTLAQNHGIPVKKIKFKSLCGDVMLSGRRCLLMKPSTYMNLSGEAVAEAMRFHKLPPERILVLFDDISLEPGKIRIRRKGSDGGHNGIKSIIHLTGSDQFPRIKIGVGQKPHPDYNLADWVLSNFTKDEIPLLHEAADHAGKAAELIVQGRISDAMNLYNS